MLRDGARYDGGVTDPRRLDAVAEAMSRHTARLRYRLPDYGVVFLVGALAIAGLGAAVGALVGASLPASIGWTAMSIGVALASAGAVAGGGYGNLGIGDGIGRMTAHSSRDFRFGETTEGTAAAPRVSKRYGVGAEAGYGADLLGGLRLTHRPGKNPSAFWTVVAGGLYTAIGAWLVLW